LSYLFSTGDLRSPLDNTMRISLTFNIDEFANAGTQDQE